MAPNPTANPAATPSLHPSWMTWSFDLLCVAYAVARLGWTSPDWCLPTLIGFGAFATLYSLLLPIQNKVALLTILGGLGCVMEWGLLHDGTKAVALGVTYLFTLAATRTALQYLSRHRRDHRYYGFWLVGVTTLFGSLQICSFLSTFSAAPVSLGQWGTGVIMALGLLLIATPYFIPKRPTPRTWRSDSLHLWMSGTMVFAITAWKQGYALLGLLLATTLTVLWLARDRPPALATQTTTRY